MSGIDRIRPTCMPISEPNVITSTLKLTEWLPLDHRPETLDSKKEHRTVRTGSAFFLSWVVRHFLVPTLISPPYRAK